MQHVWRLKTGQTNVATGDHHFYIHKNLAITFESDSRFSFVESSLMFIFESKIHTKKKLLGNFHDKQYWRETYLYLLKWREHIVLFKSSLALDVRFKINNSKEFYMYNSINSFKCESPSFQCSWMNDSQSFHFICWDFVHSRISGHLTICKYLIFYLFRSGQN